MLQSGAIRIRKVAITEQDAFPSYLLQVQVSTKYYGWAWVSAGSDR